MPEPDPGPDVLWGPLSDPFAPVTLIFGQTELGPDTTSPMYFEGSNGYAEGQAYQGDTGNWAGADAFFGDGFDSGDASAPKFELAAVKLPASDPASSRGEHPNAASSGYLGLLLLAVVQPEVGIPALAVAALSELGVEGAVAIAEAGVVVEEVAPRIEAALAQVESQQLWTATEDAQALLQKGTVTNQELQAFLQNSGYAPERAESFANSFEGNISIRLTDVGEHARSKLTLRFAPTAAAISSCVRWSSKLTTSNACCGT